MAYLVPALLYLFRFVLSFVCANYHVCGYLGSVYTFPNEQVVGKGVGVVPSYLACYKVFHAAALEDLRKLGVVSKRVRNPEDLAFVAWIELSVGFEPFYELPYESLSAR